MPTKLCSALGLAALSSFVAEMLLGDQFLGGRGPSLVQLPMFLLFVCFYGSAAVLIREFARRTGRGWPTIVACALAFGVLEEGLFTESLFNPNYAGYHLLAQGYLPALGIGVPWTLYVLTLHTVWSISVPIALVERVAPDGPWLRPRGLVTFAVLAALGGAGVFVTNVVAVHFRAAPGQLVGAAVVGAALVVGAYTVAKPRPANGNTATEVPPLALLLGAAVLSTAVLLVRSDAIPAWLLSTFDLVCTLGAALVIARLARTTAWGGRQVYALAAGATLTYCWYGLRQATEAGTGAVVEQTILVLATLAGLAVLGTRVGAWRTAKPVEPAV